MIAYINYVSNQRWSYIGRRAIERLEYNEDRLELVMPSVYLKFVCLCK